MSPENLYYFGNLYMTNADAPITVGLQRSYYSAEENSGQLQVCVEIVSGEVDGRAISLSYETINGLAVGMDRVLR